MQYDIVRYITIQYSTIQYSTIQYDTVQYDIVRYSTIQYDIVRYSTIEYDIVRYSTIQYDTVRYSTKRFIVIKYIPLCEIKETTFYIKGKNSKGNSVNFKADEDDPVKNDSVVAADVGKSETTKDSGIEDTRKTSSSSSEQGMHAAEKEGKVQGNERGNEMDVGESGHGMEAENVPTSLRQRSTSLKRKVFGVTEKKFEEKREGSDREFNRETEHGVKARKHNSLRRQILHRSDKSIDIDSDSSDSQSLKSLELDGDGDWDNISQHTLFSKDGTVQQNVQKTSAVFSNVVRTFAR